MKNPHFNAEQALAARELAITYGSYIHERRIDNGVSITWARVLQRQQASLGIEVVPNLVLAHQIDAWQERRRLRIMADDVQVEAREKEESPE